ncbi:MAG: electron transport complex subunit RsxD [Halomonadaceae bacterium]|nr:MAG: electron transport complex subunit RsxD [Halomonadaceae bacterium]
MTFIARSSPHAFSGNSTGRLMQWVMLASVPGLLAQTWFFGWGNLINVLWCMALAVGAEAVMLRIRKRPVRWQLEDCTALVTGLLLGLSLPPLLPWWISALAVISAIVMAKHLYGGLGNNPFNPAMVGYAVVLISFPLAMTTTWAMPAGAGDGGLSLWGTLVQIFAGSASSPAIDGVTMATPLDLYKQQIHRELASTVTQHPAFGDFVARGWEWVNLGFLAGGLLLLWRRIITWHIPVSFLAALAFMALLFGWDPDQSVPLSLHLLAGGTMLGAFFIATDPVSGATSNKGKLVYGAGIGALLYIIRAWGSYPDAVAFAVLLMNFAVPFIDHYTQPRSYGHQKPRRVS